MNIIFLSEIFMSSNTQNMIHTLEDVDGTWQPSWWLLHVSECMWMRPSAAELAFILVFIVWFYCSKRPHFLCLGNPWMWGREREEDIFRNTQSCGHKYRNSWEILVACTKGFQVRRKKRPQNLSFAGLVDILDLLLNDYLFIIIIDVADLGIYLKTKETM